MAHRRSIAFPFTAVLAALMVLACVSPAPAAPEGTMTIGVHVTLVSRWLDPADTEGLITPFMVLYAIHDALVKPMPGGLNTPSLAESWSVSKDGITYEFVIRKGARFHNGDPVTADDVKFTFERYRGSGNKLLKEKVKEVQIAAPNRVRFVLKEPWPDFMATYGTSATGAGWIVPKKYVEKVGEEGFKKVPIGAGPFKFVSFNPGVELVLEAFPDYWRKAPAVKQRRDALHPRREHARRRGEDGRGRHRLPLRGRAGRRAAQDARAQDRRAARVRDLLARLPRPVGAEVAVARPPRAPGREPRHRPRRAQPGRDARPRQDHRLLRAPDVRVLLAHRRARLRSQARQAAPRRGRVSERLRIGRSLSAAALHRARRGGRELSPGRRDQDAACGRWSAPPSSRAGGRRSSRGS